MVENQSGAGGRIAARQVEQAPPDGTRLLLAKTSVMAITPLVFSDAGYDLLGFVPVAGAAEFAAGLATGPATPDLTTWLRGHPAQANLGVPAIGSLPNSDDKAANWVGLVRRDGRLRAGGARQSLGLHPFFSTPVFTEATVPPGLLRSHRTAPGIWGLIRVLEGRLLYRVLDPLSERVLDPSSAPGMVEPNVPHEVAPLGPVRFHVEFHRMAAAAA